MDLQSADDKLLTSILKYANYTTINRLRKLNEKINKFAKESSWLRTQFIQEKRRLYALLTSGRNADITPCSYISHLAINKNYRRYGLATELLRRAIEISKQSGQDMIYLYAEQSNPPAILLFEKNGFKNEAVIENYYRIGSNDSDDGIIFVMNLDENGNMTNTPVIEEPVSKELKENKYPSKATHKLKNPAELKFIQEQEHINALRTGKLWNGEVHFTPKNHFNPTSGDGPFCVIYRQLQHKDWQKADRLGSLAFPNGGNIYWEYLLQPPTTRYVIGAFDSEDNLLGAVCMRRDDVVSKSTGELERMEIHTRNLIEGKYCSYIVFVAVNECYRRYGLASELLRRTIEESRTSGLELIYLHTEQRNQPARRLYEKSGFTNEAVLEKFYGMGNGNRENGVLYVIRHKENTELNDLSSSKMPESNIHKNTETPEPISEENPEKQPY